MPISASTFFLDNCLLYFLMSPPSYAYLYLPIPPLRRPEWCIHTRRIFSLRLPYIVCGVTNACIIHGTKLHTTTCQPGTVCEAAECFYYIVLYCDNARGVSREKDDDYFGFGCIFRVMNHGLQNRFRRSWLLCSIVC